MNLPLMPKATAVWLIENTAITFDQIAEFTGLHMLEIKAIADGEHGTAMVGFDPIANNQLTSQEIERCQNDPTAKLKLNNEQVLLLKKSKEKGAKYTPMLRRFDRPDAIAWIVRTYPTIPDSKICILVGTTKNTVDSIRNRTHWNIQNIKPRSPVLVGLCSQKELDVLIEKYHVQTK